ncbi:MAG: hypothetical protein ACM3SQ_01075 [Betaproteobacteria bacterium]
MRHLRRMTRCVAATWLSAQAATLVAVPLALSLSVPAALPGDCCPGAGPGHKCPMHDRSDGARTCRIATSCGSDAGLLSLVGIVALLPRPIHAAGLFPVPRRFAPNRAPLVSRAGVPEPPPPRA